MNHLFVHVFLECNTCSCKTTVFPGYFNRFWLFFNFWNNYFFNFLYGRSFFLFYFFWRNNFSYYHRLRFFFFPDGRWYYFLFYFNWWSRYYFLFLRRRYGFLFLNHRRYYRF